MRECESVRDPIGEPHRIGKRQRAGAFDPLLQGQPGDVLHDNERQPIHLTDIEDTDDVRVGKLCKRAGLFDEKLPEGTVRRGLGVEHLDRDLAPEGGVLRQIHL